MLTPPRSNSAGGATERATLRDLVLGFLALNERPGRWTFFRARSAGELMACRRFSPDIVLDVGGRIAYVEVRRQGSGPLPPERAAGLALARYRGSACFVVRSLPEMERALRLLGVPLRPRGRLTVKAPAAQKGAGEGPDVSAA